MVDVVESSAMEAANMSPGPVTTNFDISPKSELQQQPQQFQKQHEQKQEEPYPQPQLQQGKQKQEEIIGER